MSVLARVPAQHYSSPVISHPTTDGGFARSVPENRVTDKSRLTDRYRCISMKRWNDPAFKKLSDDAKLVCLHAESNPHSNPIGVYQATIEGLAVHLGWTAERYRKAFKEASSFLAYDEEYWVVCLLDFMEVNQPSNPNVLVYWLGGFEILPESPLTLLRLKEIWAATAKRGESFIENWKRFPKLCDMVSETFRKPSPNVSATLPEPFPSPVDGQDKSIKMRKAPSDGRAEPLKQYVTESWEQNRGCKISSVTSAGDWVQFSGMLKRTASDPVMTLDLLKAAWDRFMTSEEPFHKKQGLGYFCSGKGLTQFLNGHAKKADPGAHTSFSCAKKPDCETCEDIGAVVVVFDYSDGPNDRIVAMSGYSEFKLQCMAKKGEQAEAFRCKCEAGKQWQDLPVTPRMRTEFYEAV